jgi:hypothetical protein
MSVDRRSRRDGERVARPAGDIVLELLIPALAEHGELLADGVRWLGLAPLTLLVEDEAWTFRPDRHGVVSVEAGQADDGPVWRMTAQDLADLVDDQTTVMAFFSSGRLDQPRGKLGHLLDWSLVVRGACDGMAIHTPGSVSLTNGDGDPLDLGRSFGPDDDPDEISAFLHAAGFVHLVGRYTPEEMAQVSADMDRAASTYSPDDGESWWATVNGADQRLVRMQGFQRHSPTVASLLTDDRLASIGRLTGDGHLPEDPNGTNPIEALFKPIGVTAGISDVPWHKDCSLGRHSYECCRLTVGISVTPGGPGTGQLRVVAGSHRALVWPALDQPRLDLPAVSLPTGTGDVTVHLSCTLHMAEPPTVGERRVMYTDCRLPLDAASAAEGRRRLREVREAAPTTVSQPSTAAV